MTTVCVLRTLNTMLPPSSSMIPLESRSSDAVTDELGGAGVARQAERESHALEVELVAGAREGEAVG